VVLQLRTGQGTITATLHDDEFDTLGEEMSCTCSTNKMRNRQFYSKNQNRPFTRLWRIKMTCKDAERVDYMHLFRRAVINSNEPSGTKVEVFIKQLSNY
jgi:hypothetical protein